MVCFKRFLMGMAVVVALGGICQIGSAGDDDPKPAKNEAKKIEMPKLPEGANPKWEMQSVEEKFTIIKGGLTEQLGEVYFLLELKEDMNKAQHYTVNFFDAEGIQLARPSASHDPSTGKKGDRVRLTIKGPPGGKATWVKTVKVQFVPQ